MPQGETCGTPSCTRLGERVRAAPRGLKIQGCRAAVPVNRPTLLFLSHRLPWPPHNGAAIRSYNLILQLAQEFDIIALCFDRVDPALADLSINERCDAIGRFGSCEVFPLEQAHSRVRYLWDHLRSVITRLPYVHYVHESHAFEQALRRELASGSFDLVHIDSLDLQRFLPWCAIFPWSAPTTTPSRCCSSGAWPASLASRAWYMRHQAALLARGEATLLPRVRPERHRIRGGRGAASGAGALGSLRHHSQRRGH